MKKLMSLILVLLCLFSLVSCDEKVVNSGSCGENAKWSFYESNTLVISGNGDMKEYYDSVWYQSANVIIPWHFYSQQSNKIVVEEGVTSICAFAFLDAKLCTEIEIAKSVTYIGHCAFEHMNNLDYIILNKSIKKLGSMVFHSGSYNVYYEGSMVDFNNIEIVSNSGYTWDSEFYGTLYFYSETKPVESGYYWHYSSDNIPVIWQ